MPFTWTRARSSSTVLDLAAVASLVTLALAIRLPTLLTVPRFTDEQLDVLYTLPLYRLQGLPLVGFDPYNGPLFSWLMAVLFWIVGPQPFVPRLLSTLLATGAVVLTYFLGRAMAGRLAGLVGAGLLTTCAVHIIVSSHIAWSNATTSFWTTLAFLVILPAVTRGSARALTFGGLAFGLALQSHPSVITLLPGVGLAVLLRRPRLVLSRWAIVAGMTFLLGYGPVIVYNLQPKGEDHYRKTARSVDPALADSAQDTATRLVHEQEINAEGNSGLRAYPGNLGALAVDLPRVAASLIEPRVALTDFLVMPSFWLYTGLLLGGLLWPLTRGNPLPTLSVLSAVALLPLVNGKYEPIFNGRYVMGLLPLLFASFGGLVSQLWEAARARGAGRQLWLAWQPLVLVVGAFTLVAWPLLSLTRYNRQAVPDGQVNLDLIDSARGVAATWRPDEPLLLDEALGRRNLPADGDLLMTFRVNLELLEVPFAVGPASAGKLEGELGPARTALVVFAQPYDRALEARYRFVQLEDRPGARYAVYRIERRS